MRRLCCGQVASIEHTSTTLRGWIKTSHNSKPTNPILADCSLNKRNCQENRRWWSGFLSSKDVSDQNKWIITIPMILPLCSEETRKHKIQKKTCLVGSGLVVTGGTKKKVMVTTTRDCQNSSCFSDTTWHKRNIQMHKNGNSNGDSMSIYSNHNRRMQIFLASVFSCSLPQDDCMLWNSSFYCSWTRFEKVPCHVSLHQSKTFSYEIFWKSRRKWNFKISHFWKLCTIGRMAFCDVEQLRQQSNHSTLCYNINARHQMWLLFNI